MQFRDLKAQYRALKPQIDQAIQTVLDEGHFIMGRQVIDLEESLAQYVGVKHCVACANGTDALSLVLMAWGVTVGDAVFVPDFTFFATGEVAALTGATAVFVDVDKDTFNIDPVRLEEAITKVIDKGQLKPRVIIPVDLFGLPANCAEIEAIAKKYDLLMLEDGAQGFGGRINHHRVCNFGQAAATSFFPAKPLGCYGDGGAVFTNDDDLAEVIRSIAVHGKGSSRYDNIRIGMNSRLDTIQAAILQVKLEAFIDHELEQVNAIAARYTDLLKDVVRTPVIPAGYYSSWAQYTIQLGDSEQRELVQHRLNEHGIPAMIYYHKPMHKQTAFAYLPQDERDFPVSNALCERVLSLPIHPYMKAEEQDLVVEVIRRALR